MHHIRLIPRLAIVALTIAACSSDDAATRASTGASSSTTATSSAPTTTEPPGREIHATATEGAPPKVGEPICDSQQHCMIPLTLTGTYAGDLMGTSVANGAGVLVGSKYAASDTLIYTGSVAGCGTGTMVIIGGGVGSTDGSATSEWEIADGFGTGDLISVHGTGTTTTATSSDGTLTATVTARITCD
jgi:hypothetical protein